MPFDIVIWITPFGNYASLFNSFLIIKKKKKTKKKRLFTSFNYFSDKE